MGVAGRGVRSCFGAEGLNSLWRFAPVCCPGGQAVMGVAVRKAALYLLLPLSGVSQSHVRKRWKFAHLRFHCRCKRGRTSTRKERNPIPQPHTAKSTLFSVPDLCQNVGHCKAPYLPHVHKRRNLRFYYRCKRVGGKTEKRNPRPTQCNNRKKHRVNTEFF